ncbi:hypothetical protein AB0C34_15700 [Nocardia sp. NPDC049220]|uniref:hypothetical protein n=1 Tax=Nocardia sp. NPDC049220 TaxID=3155273 RepID=UPI0033EF459D
MPADLATATVVVAAVASLGWVIFVGLPYVLNRYGGCHPEPEGIYSLQQAHEVMQERINCDADSCAAKRAAMDVLIAANHFVPARVR